MLNAPEEIRLERLRYAGIKQPVALRLDVGWGEAKKLRVPAGATISVTNVDGGSKVWMTGLTDETPGYTARGLAVPQDLCVALDTGAFDHREMSAIAGNRDSNLSDARVFPVFDETSAAGETYLTRATQDQTLFVVAPSQPGFVPAGGGGSFAVAVTSPDRGDSGLLLHEPLGKIVEEYRVARGTARAYDLKKGQFVQVIDVEGQQCSDFMAMHAASLDRGQERYIDSTVTRTLAHGAYPLPGLHDKFFDQEFRPLLSVRQDTVGRHDTFALACTAYGYEERGYPGHINCSDNISAAYAPYGIQARKAWPAINFFFNSSIDAASSQLSSDEAWSRPGDYVAMQALTDLVCVSTACPDDVDPINGWNPTDIHVRIYEEDTAITHSVAWRAQPEDAARLTRQSAFHPRLSALTSNFRVARDLWVAGHFDATGAVGEYWACKNAATLQDMSGLRKFDIIGPDAEELLQHCLSRNVSKLAQHRGLYALMCDERGQVLDDGTLFRLEHAVFRWCCGSDESALHMRELAESLGLRVWVRNLGHKMVNLALQGPRSRDILREIVLTKPSRPALENLKWFGFTIARLGDDQGPLVMISRTGFTGELGYEIFCDTDDALAVWDRVMQAGAPHGLAPMGGDALDMLRIEAGLMISGAEFGHDADALESGLGFAVDFKKDDFIGRSALERNASATRRVLVGLNFAGNEPPLHGDGVFVGRNQVGTVTSACYSPQLGHAIAMARVAVEDAELGQELEVGKLDGAMKRLPCTVTSLPFLDPKREKARA